MVSPHEATSAYPFPWHPKSARTALGLGTTTMARMAGVTVGAIRRYEQDRASAPIRLVPKLDEVYDALGRLALACGRQLDESAPSLANESSRG